MDRDIDISCSKDVDKQKIYNFFAEIHKNIVPNKFKANHYKNGKHYKYSEEKFKKAFFDEISVCEEDIRINLQCEGIDVSLICYKVDIAFRIFIAISDEIYNRIKPLLYGFIVENAIIASETNAHDTAIQNQKFIHMLEWMGENPDDYPKCRGTIEEYEIDIPRNPGYKVAARGFMLAAFYRMWFGKDAYELFDKEVLRSFPCYENIVLENDVTRITLYENILDYKKKENRDKQWEFREKLHLDEIASRIKNEEETERNRMLNPLMDIMQGSFEHGGVRLIRTYLKNGENVKRSEADIVEESELDENGNVLYRVTKDL